MTVRFIITFSRMPIHPAGQQADMPGHRTAPPGGPERGARPYGHHAGTATGHTFGMIVINRRRQCRMAGDAARLSRCGLRRYAAAALDSMRIDRKAATRRRPDGRRG